MMVDSPTRLEEIGMRLERLCAAAGPDAAAIIMGLDGLAMYSSPDLVAEFSHFMANRFRTLGFTVYLMAREDGNMAARVEDIVDRTVPAG